MKGLSIEQKAKRYDEALEKSKRLYEQGTITESLCYVFPELKENEDERIRKAIHIYLDWLDGHKDYQPKGNYTIKDMIAWLEKQGEQNPTQKTESFEAEHGKYYYCIKDYFCGGKKQASKGDVIQALRGLPIMCLKDVSEYFLPVNFIKCYRVWSEEDENRMKKVMHILSLDGRINNAELVNIYDWLKSLRPQNNWKPSEEQIEALDSATENCAYSEYQDCLRELIGQLKKLREE